MRLSNRELIRFADDDRRILQLADWVVSILGEALEFIEFASADASFRRYFRIGHQGLTYVVMDSPVNEAEFEAFIRIARKFKQLGLNVPEVYAADYQHGYALLTDFGNTTYLSRLAPDTADVLYEDAIGSLLRLQNSTFSDPNFLPLYSAELLLSEMELFRQWYLKRHLQIEINAEINEILDQTFAMLRVKAEEQPRVWVHLDYHSRNLMVVDHDSPGVLDFQNAVYGPITYDLVSLLRDCYIVWDQEKIDRWIQNYLTKAALTQLELNFDAGQFLEWFDWMGMQRHVKVAGIFSRLNYRDDKPNYLQDIPRVMSYIETVSTRYPELGPFTNLLRQLPKH